MSAHTVASSELPDANALRGVRVLVVDDEPVLATTFCLVLQWSGAIATSAANGLEALRAVEHQTFDVILCDWHMPVMSGPEFIREMNHRGNASPILLFLTDSDEATKRQVRGLHIAGTVSKPLLPPDLIAAIRAAARRSHPA